MLYNAVRGSPYEKIVPGDDVYAHDGVWFG